MNIKQLLTVGETDINSDDVQELFVIATFSVVNK